MADEPESVPVSSESPIASEGLVATLRDDGSPDRGSMLVEVEPIEFAAAESLAAPVWQVRFDDVRVGDCRVRNGLMYIYDDGTYSWAGDYMSTDTNDFWYQWFRWLDAGKVEIARCRETFIGINDANTWIRWTWRPTPTKPETPIIKDNMLRIGWVEMRCRC